MTARRDGASRPPAAASLTDAGAKTRTWPNRLHIDAALRRARTAPLAAASLALAAALAGDRAPRRRPVGTVDRPAAAALCQPEDRPRQSARRALEGPRDEMGVPARRAAGRDHRGIRDLAQGARFRGRGGLGAALAALGPPHRAGRRRARRSETFNVTSAPARRSDVVAQLQAGVIVNIKRCDGTGARSTATATRATCARPTCGASTRTRRSSRGAGARADPPAEPRSCAPANRPAGAIGGEHIAVDAQADHLLGRRLLRPARAGLVDLGGKLGEDLARRAWLAPIALEWAREDR